MVEDSLGSEFYHFLGGFGEICFGVTERRRHHFSDFRKGDCDVRSMQFSQQTCNAMGSITCRRFDVYTSYSINYLVICLCGSHCMVEHPPR